MDDARKNAYRYLLYWAMLDIRPVAWLRFRWWAPRGRGRDFKYVRFAGNVADWLHNLALFASIDFQNFDEQRFWQEHESLEQRFGEFHPERYRNLFEGRLQELAKD